jgi:hypothetical protein
VLRQPYQRVERHSEAGLLELAARLITTILTDDTDLLSRRVWWRVDAVASREQSAMNIVTDVD